MEAKASDAPQSARFLEMGEPFARQFWLKLDDKPYSRLMASASSRAWPRPISGGRGELNAAVRSLSRAVGPLYLGSWGKGLLSALLPTPPHFPQAAQSSRRVVLDRKTQLTGTEQVFALTRL